MDNSAEAEFWASETGRKWVTHAPAMDAVLAPVLDVLLQAADPAPGHSVVDIGCGTGASVAALAARVGPTGQVLGVDIAQPLLDHARSRTGHLPQVTLRHADAAVVDFDGPGFDHLLSRFGVMFFADTARAFANMARALRPGGKVTVATWGQIDANPWFTDPAQAARKVLGAPPKSDPDAPGPFALRDIERTVDLLRQAGLRDVTGRAVELTLDGGPDLDAAAALVTQIGAAARAIRHFDAGADAVEAIRLEVKQRWSDKNTDSGPKIHAQINLYQASV